ncbi:MAG: DUF3160 domain-containing protein [Cyclobacteriaceae bacterium]
MNQFLKYVASTHAIVVFLFVLACDSKTASESTTDTEEQIEKESNAEMVSASGANYQELRDQLPTFDLNQDLSNKTVGELRILRNTIPARYGYLFMSSDLRNYFYNTPWYSKLMESRWYGDCEYSGLEKAPPIEYSPEEKAFMEKVKKLEEEKRGENYITRNGLQYANVNNIVNAWQYGQLPKELLDGLDRNGFAIVPQKNVQLFHVYEQNDYSQSQNFVSTDIYLQLFHMHFSFMLRGLEEERFVPILGELLFGIMDQAKLLKSQTDGSDYKDAIEYNEAFYAIPLEILGAKGVEKPMAFKEKASRELALIDAGASTFSSLLPAYEQIEFPYDLFKPRGHYTRTDTLKRYFKSMQWLQTAPYCLAEDTDFKRALVIAFILNNGKGKSGKTLTDLYRSILEPTSFLIGQPDNISILDVCNVLKRTQITEVNKLFELETMSLVRRELQSIQNKNIIKPKIENTCSDKINFMPSRFVLDNEVLQTMADIENRPFPKGLDVLASFGSEAAEKELLKDGQEVKSWDKFLPNLQKMKSKYKNYEEWDATVYAKWIKGLNAMLKPESKYPSFMQLPSWSTKNLNTALASWAELKHDAILYAEQPFAAECGGGEDCEPPPEPYVVGYVEPNTNYWKEALDLLALTEKLLTRHGLYSNSLKSRQSQLRELCTFLLNVSEKELRGEKLSEQEYRTIELIGTNVENITLSIVGVYEWNAVSGPDKEVAVVADIYTNNMGEKAGILHAAVGYVNDLYVVVEIEGYLYLTKGATLSYYEFPVPLDSRLTDEQWQEMLQKGEVYPPPSWMKDVTIILDKSLEPKVKAYNYSSGC